MKLQLLVINYIHIEKRSIYYDTQTVSRILHT